MNSPGISEKNWYCASIATNATSAMVIDTLGYEFCVLDVTMGTANTTAPASFSIQESDDAGTYTTVAALTGGTATSATVGFVIPTHRGTVTTYKDVYSTFNIDLRSRKRYLKVLLTPTDATETVTGVASLYRADAMPTAAGTAVGASNATLLVNA